MCDLLTDPFIAQLRRQRRKETPMLNITRTRPGRFAGCTPPTPAQRMQRYSRRHAEEMRLRENMGAAAPVARAIDGRTVLLALPGRINTFPTRED